MFPFFFFHNSQLYDTAESMNALGMVWKNKFVEDNGLSGFSILLKQQT